MCLDSPSLYVQALVFGFVWQKVIGGRESQKKNLSSAISIKFMLFFGRLLIASSAATKAQKISRILDFFFSAVCCESSSKSCVYVEGGDRNEMFSFLCCIIWDMNDKTSIFLRQHIGLDISMPFPPGVDPTSKKFICKMRQRIDGISAHESSDGNRVLCLKGISFRLSFFHSHRCFLLRPPWRSSLSDCHLRMQTVKATDQQSCWWIHKSDFVIKL